jgi:hypothetical protein
MSISPLSKSSFYTKFMQILSQEKQITKTVESTQPTSTNEITPLRQTDTIEISAAGRAYMQVRMSMELKEPSETIKTNNQFEDN